MKKVLVVDDEQDVVAYFSTMLEDHGYQTIVARDGDEALKKLREEVPDLITLDITMPNKSGVRVYRELKSNDALKAVPVIIITGVDNEFRNFISTRTQVPAPEGFLEKPVKAEDLLAEVKKLLG